ncbi:MAG: DUF5058 family protein [Oscillospiraceae bacterium]|jgi:hypothetical protein|nr:DUF5058 family protein [Oscillospiraceae bacterium]
MDFKQSAFMYALGGAVVVFVTVQSLFFLRKAWRRGREIGISAQTLRGVVTSSVLFTVAPSLAIAATVLALSNSLGLVLPWIRLSVIGNLSYEATAAAAAASGLGLPGGLNVPVDDPAAFSAIAWVMTIGSVFPLVLLPLFLKKIQAKIGKAAVGKAAWTDLMSAAAFIGLIAAFVARAIAGKGEADRAGDGAGVLSVLTLATAVLVMVLLELLIRKRGWKWAEPFAMPLSMFAAMGMAVVYAHILPASVAFLEWRG